MAKAEVNYVMGEASNRLSAITADTTMKALALIGKIDKRRETAVAVASGASLGALQVLAAVIGKGDTAAHAVSNDSLMVAALLALFSLETRHLANNPDAVENRFDQTPLVYLKAFEAFERLTGRKAEDCIHPDVVAYANLKLDGAEEATDLLNRICANQRPA